MCGCPPMVKVSSLVQIKVAVQADRRCVRSYIPESGSRNFNTLSLVLKTSSPDNLLFFHGSNTTVRSAVPSSRPASSPGDFLSMLDVSRWTSWPWRRVLGQCPCCGTWAQAAPDWTFPEWTSPTTDGQGSTPHGKPTTPAGIVLVCPPAGRFDGSDGSRFGARASLWVHQLESDSEPLPAVTGTSPGPARILDVDRNSLIYIGGLGAHGEVSLAKGQLCRCVCR